MKSKIYVFLIVSLSCGPSLPMVIDLTWPFNSDTIYWKDTVSFSFSKQIAGADSADNWYASNDFCAGEHGGTHLDAPYHFNKNGWKVGEIPLHRLITNGITIDLSEETKLLQDQTLLLPKHIIEWEHTHGPLPTNCVILVKFGWSQYYTNKNKYLGIDENNVYHFPGISKAAAEWITQSEKVVGVGVDTASVDPGNATIHYTHQILNKHQIYLLENVKLPSSFPEDAFTLYVMPMNIEKGTGAPLRLIAQTNLSRLPVLSNALSSYPNFIAVSLSVIIYLLK